MSTLTDAMISSLSPCGFCGALAVRPRKSNQTVKSGIYVASRVKHAEDWKRYRSMGYLITSSWIDEAGEGETNDFSELWHRIETEIRGSRALVLYVLAEDFPLKGALVECGIALAAGVPIFVYTDAELEGRTMRPIGSWVLDNRVTMCKSLVEAMVRAKGR